MLYNKGYMVEYTIDNKGVDMKHNHAYGRYGYAS